MTRIFLSLILALILLGYAYPPILFKSQSEVGNYRFFHQGDVDSASLRQVASRCDTLIKQTRLYEPVRVNILICNNFLWYNALTFAQGSFGVFNPLTHYVIIAKADFKKGIAFQEDGYRTFTLPALLAHEVTHLLTQNRIGFWAMMRLETICQHEVSIPEIG